MMIVMKEGATEEQIAHVVERIEEVGCSAHLSQGELLTVIGAIGDRDRVASLGLEGVAGVDHLVPILKPYKLASAQFKKGERTVVEVDGRKIGGEHFALIAGPCTVESREQTLEVARGSSTTHGAAMLRGGAYKPRTSPVQLPGPRRRGPAAAPGGQGGDRAADRHRADGRARRRRRGRGRRRDPDRRPQHAELHPARPRSGRTGKAVLLKRGLSSTLDELLMASEYVLKEGNPNVILCERGIRTFETAYRFTLDLLAIPALRELTHLPVIVDPSHAPGRRDWVQPMSLAAAAAGADGIIVEVHNDPEHAICDGPQALPTEGFADYAEQLRRVAEVAGNRSTVESAVGVGVSGLSADCGLRLRTASMRSRSSASG